jgi:hypothetical protein
MRRSRRVTRMVARDIPAMAPPERAGVGDTNVEFPDSVRVGIELVVVVVVVVVNTDCVCRRILLANIDDSTPYPEFQSVGGGVMLFQSEGASVR